MLVAAVPIQPGRRSVLRALRFDSNIGLDWGRNMGRRKYYSIPAKVFLKVQRMKTLIAES